MTPRKQVSSSLQLVIALVLLVTVVYGCANRMAPGGGPYDEKPPRLVGSNPEMKALNVKNKRIVLTFDEFVTVKDVMKKVIISPPQLQQPRVTSIGKRVIVELEDDLVLNTTYTLDFTDAIVDNNESNPYENFSFAFSTGSEIDTMEISGKVLYARDHEPVQGVVVGVHPADSPVSSFRDTTFMRMSRTSDRAQFVMRNLKNGKYRVYALKETDGNYRYDRASEGVAFFDSIVTTTSAPALRNDTIWRDSTTVDTIMEVSYTRYMPDDLLLWFYEPISGRRFMSKRERVQPHVLALQFNHPLDSIPTLSLVDTTVVVPPVISDGTSPKYVLDQQGNGQVTVFLIDSTWIKGSEFAISYLSVDSLEQKAIVTDTLRLKYRPVEPEERDNPPAEDLEEGAQPAPPKSPFTVQVEHKGTGGRADSIIFKTSLPIDSTVLAAIQLYDANDSILKPLSWTAVQLLPGRTTEGILRADLKYGSSYEIHFDSLTFHDLYGNHLSQEVVDAFKVKKADEFSQLEIMIHDVEGPFVAELLSVQDKPIRVVATSGNTVVFEDLKPDKYALRIIQDSNANGQWDAGDFTTGLQPERVFYAPKTFELMKNWAVKENFYPLQIPFSRQKPTELIRNKPEEKKKRDLNAEREKELERRRQGGGGGFGSGGFGDFTSQMNRF